jgi:hypothetical protein
MQESRISIHDFSTIQTHDSSADPLHRAAVEITLTYIWDK